jgi:hypothetical protein
MTSIEKETGNRFSVVEIGEALEELALRKISDLRLDRSLSAVGAPCL